MESPRTGLALVPLAGAVAYSRVHTGVHWPSDVGAGITIGVGVAALTRHWWPLGPDRPARTAHSAEAPEMRDGEDMLALVPKELREAAMSMGMPRAHVIGYVSYRAARAGMITGVLLAVARISGETAPLLFTALNNQFWSTDLNAPMANLPVVIFQFALSPYEGWQNLAWGGALLITVTILVLNIIARALASLGSKG